MEHKLITELSEEQLNELLAYTPGFSAENMENIKKRCLQKKESQHRTGRRVFLAAAIAAVIISLSGIALAVSTGFDFGSFYNSLFNNPGVEGMIEIGENTVSNGLEITLLSAFVDRYTAYLTIEIRDIESDRLSDTINIINESNGIHHIITGPVTYNSSEKKATLALTVLYGYNIAELGTASLNIDAIQTVSVRAEHEILDFDLAAYALTSESISLEEWHEVHWGGGWMGGLGWIRDPDAASIWEEPVRPVRLLNHGNMNLPIGNIDWVHISNVGIADRFLHLQFMSAIEATQERSQGYSFLNEHLCLVDSNGNVIDWYYCVTGDVHELMFDIGNNTDFTGWRIALKGGESVVDDDIRGEWRLDFAVEQAMQNRILIAYPEGSQAFARLEVTCSPVRTAIQMTAQGAVIDEDGNWTRQVDGYDDKADSEKLDIQSMFIDKIIEYYLSFDKPHLTLIDGSTVALEHPNDSFDWLGGSVWFQTDYFDIESLRSITFCGDEYYFSTSP